MGIGWNSIRVLTSELSAHCVILADKEIAEIQPLPLFSCTYSGFYNKCICY